jgi:hypothetical protein
MANKTILATVEDAMAAGAAVLKSAKNEISGFSRLRRWSSPLSSV